MTALTKNELIELLLKIPGNPKVLVDGYEGGLSDLTIEKIFEKEVVLNVMSEDSWDGRHRALGMDSCVYDLEDYEEIKRESPDVTIEKVIVLSRNRQSTYVSTSEDLQELINATLKPTRRYVVFLDILKDSDLRADIDKILLNHTVRLGYRRDDLRKLLKTRGIELNVSMGDIWAYINLPENMKR